MLEEPRAASGRRGARVLRAVIWARVGGRAETGIRFIGVGEETGEMKPMAKRQSIPFRNIRQCTPTTSPPSHFKYATDERYSESNVGLPKRTPPPPAPSSPGSERLSMSPVRLARLHGSRILLQYSEPHISGYSEPNLGLLKQVWQPALAAPSSGIPKASTVRSHSISTFQIPLRSSEPSPAAAGFVSVGLHLTPSNVRRWRI